MVAAMADLKSLTDASDDAATGAALAAGNRLAKRALEDLTLTPEEKQQRDAAAKSQRTKTLVKIGVVGVVGVVAVLSLMSVLASLWMYALALLVLGGVGAGGYFYLKPKLKALKQKAVARLSERNAASDEQDKAQAARALVSAKQQKLEDELAALKAKAR